VRDESGPRGQGEVDGEFSQQEMARLRVSWFDFIIEQTPKNH
jgi:hypothetical protein